MRVPSLKRVRASAPQVIDLTGPDPVDGDGPQEPVEAPGQQPSAASGEEPDPGPEAGADESDHAAGETQVLTTSDAGPGAAAAAAEGQSAEGEQRHHGGPANPVLHRVLGFLLLTRASVGSLPPLASIAVALAWLFGAVMLGTVAVTVAAGVIGGQPLVHPPVLVSVFRMAHGMPVHTPDGAVSLVPMLPAILVVALTVRAAGWLFRSLLPPIDGAPVRGPSPVAGVAALAGSYLVLATLVATSPTTGSQDVPLTQGWAALLCVVALGGGIALALLWVRPTRPRLWLLMRAATTVVVLILAVSFALVLGNLLLSWSQFQAMSDALLESGAAPAGRLDAAALGALQLAYLPNLVVWTAAYLFGAGFAVGSDTIVSPFSVTVGTLPEVPLATLLPTGPLRWPWIPPLLIALASVLAGAGIRSAGLAGRMRTRLVVGAVVAIWAVLAMGVLAAASSGSLGDGRLDTVGPSPWVTMLWALLAIGLGQVAWALFPTLLADVLPVVSNLADWLRGRRLPRPRLRRGGAAAPHGRRRRRGAAGRSGAPARFRRGRPTPAAQPTPQPEPTAAGKP